MVRIRASAKIRGSRVQAISVLYVRHTKTWPWSPLVKSSETAAMAPSSSLRPVTPLEGDRAAFTCRFQERWTLTNVACGGEDRRVKHTMPLRCMCGVFGSTPLVLLVYSHRTVFVVGCGTSTCRLVYALVQVDQRWCRLCVCPSLYSLDVSAHPSVQQ